MWFGFEWSSGRKMKCQQMGSGPAANTRFLLFDRGGDCALLFSEMAYELSLLCIRISILRQVSFLLCDSVSVPENPPDR